MCKKFTFLFFLKFCFFFIVFINLKKTYREGLSIHAANIGILFETSKCLTFLMTHEKASCTNKSTKMFG